VLLSWPWGNLLPYQRQRPRASAKSRVNLVGRDAALELWPHDKQANSLTGAIATFRRQRPRKTSISPRFVFVTSIWTYDSLVVVGPELLAVHQRVGHAGRMAAHANDLSPIPSAPFDDLDLDRDENEEEWERRVMDLASARIAASRARLERLGIIDADGKLVSSELPPDMLPDSDTTLETGWGRMTRPRILVVAGPPSSGKTTYFPVTAFGVDSFNIDDRCAQIQGSYRAISREVRRAVAKECEVFVQQHIQQGLSLGGDDA
jgi:hypothetical protein